MFPIGTDRPQRHFPWVNILLIATNIVVYFLTHGAARGNGNDLLESAKQYILDPNHLHLYQFISYQFLHQNFWHITGNMLFLYVFGNNLNEKIGNAGYLAFYLTGGVLAGCGQLLTSNVGTLGASGSIAAVAGLFFVLLPRTNIKVFFWIYFYVDIVEIPSMWFILFNIGKDFVEAKMNGGSGVAHYAHLAGYSSGVLIGLLLLGTGLVQRDHYDLLAMVNRWKRRREYENLVRKGYDPFLKSSGATVPKAVAKGTPAAVTDPRIGALRDEISALIKSHQIPLATTKYLELKAIDAGQVLQAQDQLDVANQLMADGRYETAAQAYEDHLKWYKGGNQTEQVQLILGLIYARYLPQPERAKTMLSEAIVRLHDAGQKQMAEAELARLGAGAG